MQVDQTGLIISLVSQFPGDFLMNLVALEEAGEGDRGRAEIGGEERTGIERG